MKHLQINWKSRVTLLLVVSIIISLLMISLELTSWAEQLNQQGSLPHGDGHAGGKGKGDMPSILRYILPFVKEIVLIGVPLFITLGLMKFTALCKRIRTCTQQQ